jgi:hypothetical protein
MTEFGPGKGFMTSRRPRIKPVNLCESKEPSMMSTAIMPSRERAGKIEYLQESKHINTSGPYRNSPFAPNKDNISPRPLTFDCPRVSPVTCTTVPRTLVNKDELFRCVTHAHVQIKCRSFFSTSFCCSTGYLGMGLSQNDICLVDYTHLLHCEALSGQASPY